MTVRRWTARQARYQGTDMVIDTTRHGGIDVHYVPTRHGVVARAWIHPGLTTIALMRRGNTGATYQGTVEAIPGGWRATDAYGAVVADLVDPSANYLDAEAVLLPLRNRVRSQADYAWPTHLIRALRRSTTDDCPVCGWGRTAGHCTRPELHWTAASLAAA